MSARRLFSLMERRSVVLWSPLKEHGHDEPMSGVRKRALPAMAFCRCNGREPLPSGPQRRLSQGLRRQEQGPSGLSLTDFPCEVRFLFVIAAELQRHDALARDSLACFTAETSRRSDIWRNWMNTLTLHLAVCAERKTRCRIGISRRTHHESSFLISWSDYENTGKHAQS